ncbi:MAG: PilZ domain-containing protein [Pseudobutyrivibrio sp.]|nr:PilZ domain-containing protein [Pseudobutyrivibrio sp.]
MTIDQLTAGQEVTLEVLIGGSSFEIKTEVVGTNDNTGVLLKPYIYNGTVVDFTAGSPKSMSFNLHCIDPESNGRVVWKNVLVKLINYRDVDYYVVDSKNFGTIAASSERRVDERVNVHKPGSATKDDLNRMSVSVIDISDAGISFIGNQNLFTIGDVVEVNFADTANDSDFSLCVVAKINRAEVINEGIFFAGKIRERDNKLLAYLCFKGMDERTNDYLNNEEN